MEKILNLDYHEDRWVDGNWSVQNLIDFEDDIIKHWENGEITGPIHLSNGNEKQLIKIFEKVGVDDWVFSTWRSHYHALLHGVEPSVLKQKILDGKSITIVDKNSKFYSSAIVTGTLPIALGVAKSIKYNGGNDKVWVFLGDMAFETGIFYEAHKYLGFNLLSKGKLKEGLEEIEWRLKIPQKLSMIRGFLQPIWDGKQSLNDK